MPEIRIAQRGDLEALLPLVRGYREFYGRTHDAAAERALIERHLREGGSAIYLALDGADAVGFAQLFRTWSTVQLGPVFILEDLFVVPAARGAGVASALLDRALLHVRVARGVGMFLETAPDNETAQRVYERAGWTREHAFLKYNAPI